MLDNWKTLLKDKKIAIWGLGKEGESSYRFLHRLFPEQRLILIDRKDSLAFQKSYPGADLKSLFT